LRHILPDEGGNYQDLQGQFRLRSWELPLIFRIGASINPIVTAHHEVTVAVDALHPNNNTESVNLGGQYAITLPSFGKVFFRGGYKALFMEDSQYGLSLGFGLSANLLHNKGIRFEYAFREVGLFDKTHSYGISVLF
jgi:hypothetical protein